MNDTLPSDDTLVTIYGGRCQSCGLRTPEDNHLFSEEDNARGLDLAEKAWRRAGLGEWEQWGYPRKYPAWMVREGFRCGFCLASNVLLALTP